MYDESSCCCCALVAWMLFFFFFFQHNTPTRDARVLPSLFFIFCPPASSIEKFFVFFFLGEGVPTPERESALALARARGFAQTSWSVVVVPASAHRLVFLSSTRLRSTRNMLHYALFTTRERRSSFFLFAKFFCFIFLVPFLFCLCCSPPELVELQEADKKKAPRPPKCCVRPFTPPLGGRRYTRRRISPLRIIAIDVPLPARV